MSSVLGNEFHSYGARYFGKVYYLLLAESIISYYAPLCASCEIKNGGISKKHGPAIGDR